MFLLDAHNEYGRCFGDRAQVLNPRNLKLPFWLFNFEEIVDVFFGGRPGVDEEVEILSEVIPIAKSSLRRNTAAPSEQSRRQARTIRSNRLHRRHAGALSARRPRRADRRAHGQAREPLVAGMIYHRLITRIETVRNDPRYAFMFDNANVGGDTMAEMLSPAVPPAGERQADDHHAARRLPGRGGRLGGVGALPHGLRLRPVERRRDARCSSSARRRTATPRPTARSASARPARRSRASPRRAANTASFSASSRSARPSSTRPSSPRCSTLFAMRMANDRDQAILRSAVSDAAANLLAFVPSLGTREVVRLRRGRARCRRG